MHKTKILLVSALAVMVMSSACSGTLGTLTLLINAAWNTINCQYQINLDGRDLGPLEYFQELGLCLMVVSGVIPGQHTLTATIPQSQLQALMVESGLPAMSTGDISNTYTGVIAPGAKLDISLSLPQVASVSESRLKPVTISVEAFDHEVDPLEVLGGRTAPDPTNTPVTLPTSTPVPTPTVIPIVAPTPTATLEPTPTPVLIPTPTPVVIMPVVPTPTPRVMPLPTATPAPEPTVNPLNFGWECPQEVDYHDRPPHVFIGRVTVNGQPAPDGTIMQVVSAGRVILCSRVKDGEYVAMVPLPPQNNLTFLVYQQPAHPGTVRWAMGDADVLDLNIQR